MKNQNNLVSVIVPAYKQSKTIKSDLENIYDVLSKTRWDFEIIVVVDGSVDDTYKRAEKLKKENLHVYEYPENKGKGYALRYGFARSKGDVVVFIDAGMDIDANGISMLLEHMEWYDADIVVGSKRHLASKVDYPFIRKVYSKVYYMLVKMLFGIKISDSQTGLKAFRREVLEKVVPRLLVRRFAFDIELLSVARSLGYTKIYEAPVKINMDFRNTNFTKKILFDKNIRTMIWHTLAVFYRLRILKYYSEEHKRNWEYDEELGMKVNVRK